MQDLKISIKAWKAVKNLINGIYRIFYIGFKVLYGEFEIKPIKGRECGEALDPAFKRNQRRLKSNVVLVEDNSSSMSGHYNAKESVITRPNPSSSLDPPQTFLDLSQNLDSSIPSSPLSSCSSSGYCSDASSIQDDVFSDKDVVDHPDPPSEALQLPASPNVLSKTNLTIAMEEAENDIHANIDKLMELMATFDVIDVEYETDDYEDKLATVARLLVVTNIDIRRLVRTYERVMGEVKVHYWSALSSKLRSEVRSHRVKILAKVAEVRDSNNGVNDKGLEVKELKELELLKRQVVAQEAIANSKSNQILREAEAKRKNALIEAKAKANSIIFDVKDLNKSINETRDWKNASDVMVKKAMRNIDKWKEEMHKIIEAKIDFMILVEKNGLKDDENVKEDRVVREVDDLKSDMDAVILAIENEDTIRALFTLDTTPVRDPVKLPKFSGKDGEDFHLFKEEVERGFVRNRTPKANQLSKLQECLSGAAIALVPKSLVMTIDEAWAVLKKSYGDAYRIIKYRKAELMKVGKFPKVNTRDKGGYSQQIAWFLKIENLLKGVLDLGIRHPEYSDTAFSFEFISTVVMIFPQRLRIKLYKCPGMKGDKLKNILLKIENLRDIAQGLQLYMDASTPRSAVASGGTGARQQSQGPGGHNVVQGPSVYKGPSVLKTDKYSKKSNSKASLMKACEIDDNEETLKPVKKSISSKEATRKLKKKLRSSKESVELKPVPEGRAQFMMGQTKGRTRPLNILYDTGCYSLLLKEGVQHELGKSVLKTKGPCVVNGVGNTSVKVNDEWLTTLELLDGSRQIVEGWTVDEVTAPLPVVDLSKAVKELKDDKPDNLKLRSMFVQLVAGGDCDILLGQLYNAIFPVPVHSLPNGLTIYELQITPHDDHVNSVIGGPHESFEYMAEQVGGANFLFSQLLKALDNYKSFGPPSVTRTVMSLEVENEKILGEQHEELEVEKHSEDLFDDISEQSEERLREKPCHNKDAVGYFLDASIDNGSEDEVVKIGKVDAENDETVKTMFEGSFAENYAAILDSLIKFTEAGADAKKVKVLFEGTFIEKYEDILENLDKFVDENVREDTNHVEELVGGTEIRRKDSMCEGSRYELKVIADEEAREGKVDAQHKTCSRKSSPRSCTACCSSNPENPNNDEHRGEHDEEVQLCKLEVPHVRDVTSAGAYHPGKVPGHGLLDQHGPVGGRDGGPDSLG